MPIEEVDQLICSLLPILEKLKGFTYYNSNLCNSLIEQLPVTYGELLKQRVNIQLEIDGGKE